MEINSPVVLITLEGNVKQKVITSQYTMIASYEALRNETCVISKAGILSRSEQTQLEASIKAYFKSYGKVKTVKYYKDGADVVKMISNN